MLEAIINFLATIVTYLIDKLHYVGIIILMAIESCNIPIPSEIILPYSGFLANRGELNIHLAALAGALGCLIGSLISYYIGYKLGRPFLMKHGKWLLISHEDIEKTDRFINRFGDLAFFFSRVLPIIRTFISLVAGVARGRLISFSIYTFIGSWIWSYLLIIVGWQMGEHWDKLGPIWDRFDIIIVIVILVAIAIHVIRALKNSKNRPSHT